MPADLERTRAAKVAALRTVVRYELGYGSDDEREEAELALAGKALRGRGETEKNDVNCNLVSTTAQVVAWH